MPPEQKKKRKRDPRFEGKHPRGSGGRFRGKGKPIRKQKVVVRHGPGGTTIQLAGDMLTWHGAADADWIESFNRLPPKLMTFLRDHGVRIHVTPGQLVGSDPDFDAVSKQIRRGSETQTIGEMAGVWVPSTKQIFAGDRPVVLAHEVGHALDAYSGMPSHDERFKAIHRAIFDKLPPYYQGDEPGGDLGAEETFAQVVSTIIGPPSVPYDDGALARIIFGNEAVDYVKGFLDEWR